MFHNGVEMTTLLACEKKQRKLKNIKENTSKTINELPGLWDSDKKNDQRGVKLRHHSCCLLFVCLVVFWRR